MHREPEVLEAEAQVGKWLDCRARITLKELAELHSQKRDANLEISAPTHIARLTNSLARSLKRKVTNLKWLY